MVEILVSAIHPVCDQSFDWDLHFLKMHTIQKENFAK